MRLKVPRTIFGQLWGELRQARRREIGGLLFGEHVEGDLFRVVEATIQRSGGTNAHFVRDPKAHKPALDAFFKKTGNDYQRFNYLGEWHSHPSFAPVPSGDDIKTMKALVEDADVGANFAVLMIVRIGKRNAFEVTATGFYRGGAVQPIDVEVEEPPKGLLARMGAAIVRAFTAKSAGRRVI
jgi:proteasome lid subunit RPN8/RPN11